MTMQQTKLNRRSGVFAAAVLLAAWLSYAQGRNSAPKGGVVRLENDRVRVVEYTLMPGVPMGMHNHPRDRVEINLSRSRVRVTQAGGKSMESDEKEGAITWSKGSTEMHDVEPLLQVMAPSFSSDSMLLPPA